MPGTKIPPPPSMRTPEVNQTFAPTDRANPNTKYGAAERRAEFSSARTRTVCMEHEDPRMYEAMQRQSKYGF